MRRGRIAGGGAAFSAFMILAVASAPAQTPGAPLPLLQFVDHKSKVEFHPHPKLAARAAKKMHSRRRIAKQRLAKAHRKTVAARPAAPPPPAAKTVAAAKPAPAQNPWPSVGAAKQGAIAADMAPAASTSTLGPQPAPASVATEAVIDSNPNEILGNEHQVPTAVPEQVKPADVAARAPRETAKTAQAAASGPAPRPAAAASAPTPVVHAMVARPATQNVLALSPIGSASWIAHVLAALGGAIAAGAVAWFLIRPATERTYG